MPKLTKNDVVKKAEELKNWGKWGPDDELGVLNYITPQDIVNAARLVKRGKVFRLGLELDENGPQRGIFGGRWNPLHQMLATVTDAVAGKHDVTPGLRYADDAINLPTQAATRSGTRSRTSSSWTRCGTATRRRWSTCVVPTRTASRSSRARWSGAACCSTSPDGRASRVSPTVTGSRSPTSTRPRALRA